ncbi:hypothetical protein B0T14DRAFT_513495 [Immersiella caudata]|uniref:Aminoglycoside phosphotransferase domain-containing protein n=1 Tax=Immersiella caudata TaxID=314043 RepID=A0AA39X6I9_9PEZI|nr:hypothetical protein B0T14DRAFT_513495 [Immersiella caudata]
MSSHSSEDFDEEVFGPLLSISESSLVELAAKIQADTPQTNGPPSPESSTGRLVRRIAGSYNLVHIIELGPDFKLVVRVPATGWGDGLTPTAAQAIESQVTTMRLISAKTSIPIPQVYAFDTTTDNTIGAPYICTSFVPGRSLATAWFDTTVPMPLQDRRLRTLKGLAGCLAQLAQFNFPKIGSIHANGNGGLVIGPCYDWEEKEDGRVSINSSGPYDTAAAYMHDHFVATDEEGVWDRAATMVTKAAMRFLPIRNSEGFALSVPDFDSQNILVDDSGNISGIIDWDLVQTVPRCVGYSCYPGWITRDWDPLVYGGPDEELENSPEELEGYRRFYDQALGDAMQRSGDWEFTRKSHIWEAIWIAALKRVNRLEICCKLVQEATGDKDGARGIMYDLGSGEGDWPNLEKEIEAFLSQG